MRKTTIAVIITLFAGLMVFSCVQPLEPGVRTEATGLNQLNLTVSCQAPSTKADPFANYPAGVTELNENKIEHIDWFIFRDTTTGTAWQSGRVSFSDKTDGTTEFSVKSLDMDQYKNLYADGKGYVLTVANYPDEEGHETTFGNKTFAQIRQMELVTEGLGNMANGSFTPLNSFVMTSYATPFTLVENNPVTVNAQLTRLAAKISLNISIVPYIDEIKAYVNGIDTTRIEYVQTWYPEVEGIRAYLTYANKHTTLTPVDTSMRAAESYNDNDFFTYNSRGFKLDTPVPTTSDGTSIVTGTPFYSYPMKWETSDAHAPFIKIILKWEGRYEDNTTKPGEGRYIEHNSGGIRYGDTVVVNAHNKAGYVTSASQNFYYKVSLPSAHNILHSNVWTKISLDVAVLGGVDEEQTVDVIGRYYVVDWNNPGVEGGGELTAGKYLSLATARDTFYIYGGNSITIPVKSSHNLTISNTATRITRAQQWNPRTQQLEPINRGTVSVDGRTSVTLTNNLNTAMNTQLDCYRMEFDIQIVNDVGLEKKITVFQYPAIYIDSKPGGNAMVDGYFGNVDNHYRRTSGNPLYGNSDPTSGNAEGTSVTTPYAPITQYTPEQHNMTVVSISSLGNNPQYTMPRDEATQGSQPKTYSYLITDPREESGFQGNDLIPYWNGTYNNGQPKNWTDAQASKIKVGNTQQIASNFIAPKLLVSSRWSRTVNWGDGDHDTRYEAAKKRCATYQEGGYPAGRWRLPTEAETIFLAYLQNNRKIDALFSSGGYNVTASGTVIRVAGTGANDIHYWTTRAVSSMRCVYDLWYWGDDPVEGAASTYTIKPE